ncbi:leucyl aminopeptidase [Bacillus sp. JCM 19046]|nr:leucyl aminopeptidase [Bacillus sp. JCM 19045]GAF20342.1 leucyl aminopeptidase [Bacillus sp. JCM 19046]
MEFKAIVKNMMSQNVQASGTEYVMVLADLEKEAIGRKVFDSLCELDCSAEFVVMQTRSRSGEEPPLTVSAAMKASEICFCICEHSLTHTKARKDASANGVKVITMPGITMDMFTEGAMKADYSNVVKLTEELTSELTTINKAVIRTGSEEQYSLTLQLAGRNGISSTGVFGSTGASGNLPSGESYIAPQIEGSEGQIWIDGSIAGIGKVTEPTLLTVENGRLINATGPAGEKLLSLLGEGDGRYIAEFGIGTNEAARVTGNILEDEKAFGTIHVAFGSSKTFGGTIDAGVHLDCVTLAPSVWFEKKQLMKQGNLLKENKS